MVLSFPAQSVLEVAVVVVHPQAHSLALALVQGKAKWSQAAMVVPDPRQGPETLPLVWKEGGDVGCPNHRRLKEWAVVVSHADLLALPSE